MSNFDLYLLRDSWWFLVLKAFWFLDGFYNISNCLSITTKFDKHSTGLLEYAKENGLWDGEGNLNFAVAFSGESKFGSERYDAGQCLLKDLTKSTFTERKMFQILRSPQICRDISNPFPTQGSQVSVLNTKSPAVHWFTATPDPSKSIYKPFVFTPNVKVSGHTKSPDVSIAKC